MSKVFVNIGPTLDGYMAPEGMTLEHWTGGSEDRYTGRSREPVYPSAEPRRPCLP